MKDRHVPHLSLHSPVGELTLFEEAGALVALEWGRAQSGDATALLDEAAGQLHDYFDGRRQQFDLPLDPSGTAFDQRVWAQMCLIGHGQTRSYGDIATSLGTSARAVGAACGRNPLPILIPCHRVLATGGRIGGYSGGGSLATKRALLVLEGALIL